MSAKLFKSGMIVSVMTLVSRVLGLVRDVVTANVLGAGAMADVFLMVNRIPNFLRRLFAEGAFSQAFVPVLSEVKAKHGDDAVRDFGAATIDPDQCLAFDKFYTIRKAEIIRFNVWWECSNGIVTEGCDDVTAPSNDELNMILSS